MPDLPKKLLAGSIEEAPAHERAHSTKSQNFLTKLINLLGQMGWYYAHIEDLADGKPLNLKRGIFAALVRNLKNEYATAWRMQRSQ